MEIELKGGDEAGFGYQAHTAKLYATRKSPASPAVDV
jgi:hypothetical protein